MTGAGAPEAAVRIALRVSGDGGRRGRPVAVTTGRPADYPSVTYGSVLAGLTACHAMELMDLPSSRLNIAACGV